MTVAIDIPSSEKSYAEFRALNHEYIHLLGLHPKLQSYFSAQSFAEDIDKMPVGYEPPDGICLIAYGDGVALGVVALRRLDSTTCEMKRLYVRPDAQGMGIGKLLVERLIQEAKRLGYSCMRLDNSRSVMEKANALYKTMGFYEIRPYNDNFVADSYFMERKLV